MSSQNQPNDSDKQTGSRFYLRIALLVVVGVVVGLIFVFSTLYEVALHRSQANREPIFFDDFAEICEVKNVWWTDGMFVRVGSNADLMYVPRDIAGPSDVKVGEVHYVAYSFDTSYVNYIFTWGDASATVLGIEHGLPKTNTVYETDFEDSGHCE